MKRTLKYLKKILPVIMLFAAGFCTPRAFAQELNCIVEVNHQMVEGTNTAVFETLQTDMSDFFNNTKFTNAQFSPVERIDCRLFLTVKSYEDDIIKGELQVQLSRPVYNSTYTTTLLNFKDTKVEFEYKEGTPLRYNEMMWDNELVGLLTYYAYLFLALDFDSFSPNGGQPYFDKVATVVQQAQSNGSVGWKAFEDTKNRSAVLAAYTDPATSGLRTLMYNYHRKGLDEMVTSPDKGRAVITESLKELEKIGKTSPMSVGLSIFRDTKIDELVNIYSEAPQVERDKAYDILEPLYPTDTERLEKIKKIEK